MRSDKCGGAGRAMVPTAGLEAEFSAKPGPKSLGKRPDSAASAPSWSWRNQILNSVSSSATQEATETCLGLQAATELASRSYKILLSQGPLIEGGACQKGAQV